MNEGLPIQFSCFNCSAKNNLEENKFRSLASYFICKKSLFIVICIHVLFFKDMSCQNNFFLKPYFKK